MTKEKIEIRLKDILQEIFQAHHLEDSIILISYDEKKEQCTINMTVQVVEEDDYVGFGNY